jgi:hypothetical protein
MKACGRCKQHKDWDDFNKDRLLVNGTLTYRSTCKTCQGKSDAARYKKRLALGTTDTRSKHKIKDGDVAAINRALAW